MDLEVELTTADLAKIFKCSTQTVYGWRVAGTGPAFVTYPNGRIRYRQAEVIKWQESAKKRRSTSESASR